MNEPTTEALARALHENRVGCDWNDAAIPKYRWCDDPDWPVHREAAERLIESGFARATAPAGLPTSDDVLGILSDDPVTRLIAHNSHSGLVPTKIAHEAVKQARASAPASHDDLASAIEALPYWGVDSTMPERHVVNRNAVLALVRGEPTPASPGTGQMIATRSLPESAR